ncbi:trihelix transcription factor [Striga asiatica]|uniref:Trihelix transcription factor n=1 Tax=Striga asiatica TaxID=4170 RepID=A0A5A7PA92_STRAF|nr:trihelix transcription factor [Striga asiatica]
MLESSSFFEICGGGSPSDEGGAPELGNEGGSGGLAEDGDRNSAGNRWPRDETLALLKIRSDMDLAFRDSTLKAPLWDEVSRKLAELGYQRGGKKCKEKFENIYKYHKRTKHGRSSTPNGRNYRFFEQLEPFDSQIPTFAIETHKSTPTTNSQDFTIPCSSTSTASSSEETEGNIKKKQKLADYFERLMRDVLEKQEELQRKLLEAIERCEKERVAREEAWKAQETARIKKEQELLAQERELSAAKDAAVLAFLKKIAQETNTEILDLSLLEKKISEKQEHDILEKMGYLQPRGETSTTKVNFNFAQTNFTQAGSTRWPKAEVEALIMLKMDLDMKYQDSGPKGPLWQEISSCMKKLGYERNAKRCKEKWENINKYYKRVKDGNRKRPEDSKTCPYFNMLDSIYSGRFEKPPSGLDGLKPEQILMQMMAHNEQVAQEQPSIGEYDGCDPEEQQGEDMKDCEAGDGYEEVAKNLTSVTSLG